jgi:hypothetical protein
VFVENLSVITEEIDAYAVVIIGVAVGEMYNALNGVAVAVRPVQNELPEEA